ncbi:hypothetical protein Syun_031194 [Stephania yunnanensis]|uniref:SUN domain-containing protein n=1 Tax=Stephania yunnanensis TaxID=152371 RepID=A0AAP0HB51_9MAGN
MSASTVAITANPAVNNAPSLALGSRRRSSVTVTEKRSASIELVPEAASAGVAASEHTGGNGKDLSHSMRGESVLDRPKELPALNGRRIGGGGGVSSTVSPRRRKVVAKSLDKPKWQTVLSVFTKNLVAFSNAVETWAKSGSGEGTGSPLAIAEVESRIAEVEGLVKKTAKMMQVQVEVVDRKIENEVGGLRRELTKTVAEKSSFLEDALKKLEVRVDGLDKSLTEFRASDFLTKSELETFLDELKKSRSAEEREKDWSLDDIRAVARTIVEREVERHAADGLGKVDYALASAGGKIVAHSESILCPSSGFWYFRPSCLNYVLKESFRMLQPSFGEPGQCFPFKGDNGFVVIKLRSAIIPEALTLEHVAKVFGCAHLLALNKSVAYDQASAPKYFRISGWYEGNGASPANHADMKFLLGEFTYDLERSNAQTFELDSTDSGIINMVRLDFTSNHGAPHTCIYRIRVHGHEPDSVAVPTMRS